MRKSLSAVASVAAVLVAVVLSPGVASAATPGEACQIANTGYLYPVSVPGGATYYLGYPSYFRVVAYGTSVTYWGHGNGLPDGYMSRSAVNQATCG